MSESTESLPTSEFTTSQLMWTARLLTHVRKPENLITYLIFTAWMKFMGAAEYLPSVTIG